MRVQSTPLSFSVVDDLAFAAENNVLGDFHPRVAYVPNSLGPLVELLSLVSHGLLPRSAVGWLSPNGAAPFMSALNGRQEFWVSADGRTGFARAHRPGVNAAENYTRFLLAVDRAASRTAGFAGIISAKLVAALEEMESNIHEHSQAVDTGVVCFRAADGIFEFVVADGGIGILNSLRQCAAFASLQDHGRALECALAEGNSRLGVGIGRGLGFRQVFLSLLDMQGTLRFRSGDHALVMNGISPNEKISVIAQKPRLNGFLASISAMTTSKRSNDSQSRSPELTPRAYAGAQDSLAGFIHVSTERGQLSLHFPTS